MPESITKNVMLISNMVGSPEQKQEAMQEYLNSLESGTRNGFLDYKKTRTKTGNPDSQLVFWFLISEKLK